MESDLEDIKRMTQLIDKQKSTYQGNFQLEFQDFINFKQDQSDDDADDEFLHEEEIIVEDDDVKRFSEVLELSSELPVPVATLTEDEKSIIDSCTDSDLKRLLVLNRLKNMQLIKLHKKVKDLLLECEESIQEKNNLMKNWETKQVNQQTYIWKLAAPYFKDKKFYPSPLNEDTVKKRSNNELTIYDLTPSPKWTTIEIDRLINAVKCNYNINRQNNIVKKINALKAEISSTEESQIKNKLAQIMNLEEELQTVKNDEKIPPHNSNEFIDWHKVAETFLKDKHSATECQSVWHMLVHPDINKSEWTDQENKDLEIIAKRYSYQTWDYIAAELNTKRTGFTACLHYFSKLCDKFKKSKFTPEEDKLLLEVVDGYKVGNHIPWNKVVCHFNNRSRHQLYCRYTYFLSQNHVKRGKFSEAEDILLMILVNRFGRNFRKCAEYMPHRSQIQLKSRYTSNLQRHIKKGTFTVEDDQTILDYVQKHGEKNWSGLSEKLNRCNAQIRQRYRLIKSFVAANPDADLSEIPKRKHNFDKPGDQYNFLSYVADQYKDVDYVPTLSMIEESLQIEKRTPNSSQNRSRTENNKTNLKNIDTMLTDFFVSALNSKHNVAELNVVEASNNVEEILSMLGANLDIPKIFEYNIHLDDVDVEILERIGKKNVEQNDVRVDKLISPNLSTLTGLRSLIIKHKDYKQKNKNLPGTSKDSLLWSMEKNLSKLSEKTREELLFHRQLFSKRFDALFNWSAVLSLEKPNHFDTVLEEPRPIQKIATPTKSYVRKSVDRICYKPAVKKRKIDVKMLTNLKEQASVNGSQVYLVDKSFVDQLVKNKNNVIVATVTNSDGVIKPVLQHVGSKNNESQVANGASSVDPLQDCPVEDNEVNEDFEDLQNFNVVLKSEAAEPSTQVCNSEEYQAIRHDVQLLKEILHYEKIKVEPSIDN